MSLVILCTIMECTLSNLIYVCTNFLKYAMAHVIRVNNILITILLRI
jgi:hypothetical protein